MMMGALTYRGERGGVCLVGERERECDHPTSLPSVSRCTSIVKDGHAATHALNMSNFGVVS